VVASVALLAVEHLSWPLTAPALDAALAAGALPVIVPHATHHSLGHLNAAGMDCKVKKEQILARKRSNGWRITYRAFGSCSSG